MSDTQTVVDGGDTEVEVAAERAQSQSRTRQVSTIEWPYHDLKTAERIASAVHEQYGGRAMRDHLADALDYSSGAFRSKLSAARMFGLITIDREHVRTTDLGVRILDRSHAPASRAAAFLNVELYRALFERYRGQTLPSDKGLEGAIGDLGVSDKQADKARQVFQRSAQQAGYFMHGSNRLVRPPVTGADDEAEAGTIDVGSGSLPTDNRGAGEEPGMQADPLLASLFRTLPPKSDGFPESQRKYFMTALEAALNLIYGPAEAPNESVREDNKQGEQTDDKPRDARSTFRLSS